MRVMASDRPESGADIPSIAAVTELRPSSSEELAVVENLGVTVFRGIEVLEAMRRVGPPEVSQAASEALVRIAEIINSSGRPA
jgi:hypothetical protein